MATPEPTDRDLWEGGLRELSALAHVALAEEGLAGEKANKRALAPRSLTAYAGTWGNAMRDLSTALAAGRPANHPARGGLGPIHSARLDDLRRGAAPGNSQQLDLRYPLHDDSETAYRLSIRITPTLNPDELTRLIADLGTALRQVGLTRHELERLLAEASPEPVHLAPSTSPGLNPDFHLAPDQASTRRWARFTTESPAPKGPGAKAGKHHPHRALPALIASGVLAPGTRLHFVPPPKLAVEVHKWVQVDPGTRDPLLNARVSDPPVDTARPLLWNGGLTTPTTAAKELIGQVTGTRPPTLQGTLHWHTDDGRSLAELAAELKRESPE